MRISAYGCLALLGAIASSAAAQSDLGAPQQTTAPAASTQAWPTWNGQFLLDSKIYEIGPRGPAVQGPGGSRMEMQYGSFFVVFSAEDYQKNVKLLRVTQQKDKFGARNGEALYFESIDKPYWIVITRHVSDFTRKLVSEPLRGHCSPYDDRNRRILDFRGTLNECTSSLAEVAPSSAGGVFHSLINLGTDRLSGDFDRQYTATNVNSLVQSAFAVDPQFSQTQIVATLDGFKAAAQAKVDADAADKQRRRDEIEVRCAGNMDGDAAHDAAVTRAVASQQLCRKRGYANLPGGESNRASCADIWKWPNVLLDDQAYGCGSDLRAVCPGERKAKLREGNWLRTGGAITPQDVPFYYEMMSSQCH